MTVQISGYFPALIIGELSYAAGSTLHHFAVPYLQKYPKHEAIGGVVVNLTGSLAAACLMGYIASIPLGVAIAVNFIAYGVFFTVQSINQLSQHKKDHCLTRQDLVNFLTNLKQVSHMRDNFFGEGNIDNVDPYEIDNYGGSDSDSELDIRPE